MKQYKIRENSPIEYIRDFLGGGVVGLLFLFIFLSGL
nr:MAG TPA: syndecan-2 protein [Caudoviricetes sp.]